MTQEPRSAPASSDGSPQEGRGGAEGLITREEALSGLPARRARAALFLIENRVAHLAARSPQMVDVFPTERSERDRDLAFLEAFAQGRDPPRRPTIQDLEEHATAWSPLAPETPRTRAAFAHALGQKYAFTYAAIPRTRSVLGLDTAAVRGAYRGLYGQPVETIYAPRVTSVDRLRWAWAALGRRLIALPPFWLAFTFTVALGIPQASLAVPIAVAAIGPLPGIVLILVLGLVSIVTTAALAEAAARSGVLRYGTAYAGRLAAEYLGAPGSILLTLALFFVWLLSILASFMAISGILADFTTVPAVIWNTLLFAAALWLLARGSVTFSIALLVTVAVVIVSLMLAIMALSLGHVRLEYVTHMGLSPDSLDPDDSHVTVGVILMAYIGECFMIQCAKTVLPGDPSGRSLIRGSAAGVAAIAGLLVVWILVVNGSMDPGRLVGQRGTIIGPLGAQVGGAVPVFGLGLVVLLLGLAALRCSIATFNQTREWLPVRSTTVAPAPPAQHVELGDRARFLLSIGPIVAIFLLAQWLLVTGQDSFAGVLSIIGVLSKSVWAGFIPILLLVAGRRKGELVPGIVVPLLGNPIVVGGVYVLYGGVLLAHGLVIWENPWQRAAALLTAAAVLGVTVSIVRGGAFARRVVVELRDDPRPGGRSGFAVTAVGRPATVDALLDYPDGRRRVHAAAGELTSFAALREAVFDLPATRAAELKVWVYRVMPDGSSEGLPALLEVQRDGETEQIDLERSGGQVVLPFGGEACRLRIVLAEPPR